MQFWPWPVFLPPLGGVDGHLCCHFPCPDVGVWHLSLHLPFHTSVGGNVWHAHCSPVPAASRAGEESACCVSIPLVRVHASSCTVRALLRKKHLHFFWKCNGLFWAHHSSTCLPKRRTVGLLVFAACVRKEKKKNCAGSSVGRIICVPPLVGGGQTREGRARNWVGVKKYSPHQCITMCVAICYSMCRVGQNCTYKNTVIVCVALCVVYGIMCCIWQCSMN